LTKRYAYVAVQPLDASGRRIGSSKPVRVGRYPPTSLAGDQGSG
jgi:hypothetical protein